MRHNLYLLLIIFIGCTSSGGPNYPVPARVILVPHAPDTSAVEQGIDAVPEQNAIKLEWYKLKDVNVRYYRIYRKSEDETYFQKIKTIDLRTVSSPYDTTYLNGDSSIVIEKYFSYFVTAVSKDNAEGARSDTANYKLLAKPVTDRPNNEVITGTPVFEWTFEAQSGIPNQYILRIEEEISQKLIFAKMLDVINYDWQQVLNFSSIDSTTVFQPGISYRWRIDTVGQDETTSGSESEWKTFRVN